MCSRQVAASFEDRKASSLSPGQGNLKNNVVITISTQFWIIK